jgi:hypothetical protein
MWDDPYELPSEIRTLLSPDELRMLYNLAKSYYTGLGNIVDAGCFVGGSTRALLDGLSNNRRFLNSSHKVYAYDLFRTTDQFNVWGDEVHASSSASEYFSEFKENVCQYQARVTSRQGDILEHEWHDGPIEILFVDIAKSPEILQHIEKSFFPSLLPGRSYLVHQDFQYPGYPWIVVSMELMKDYWQIVDFLPNNSAVYRLVKRIPPEFIVNTAWSELSLSYRKCLHRRALQRMPLAGNLMLQMNEVQWLLEEKQEAAAHELLQKLRREAAVDHNALHQVEVTARRLFPKLSD